jgi:superfamily II DNA or RNA helicase
MSRKSLHPYQAETIQKLGESFRRGHRRIVCQVATGGGKSVIQTHITFEHLRKGGQLALLTAPRKELVRQNHKHLAEHGMGGQVGIIRGGIQPQYSRTIQVATVPALERRVAKGLIRKPSLVLVDECHLRSKLLERLMGGSEWEDVLFLGFSATPWTKGMGNVWDDLVIGATTKQLIGDGYLVPFETYASQQKPDLTGVRTVETFLGPDYQEEGLAEAMSRPTIIADVVETGIRLAVRLGLKLICFCVNLAHAKAVFEAYCAAGVSAAYIDGKTPDGTNPGEIDERTEIKKGLESGKYEVVVNCQVLQIGSDWPFVDCIQLARPTRSEMLYTQMLGRGLRNSPGKTMLRILDHTEAWRQLGPVDEIHYDELDDGSSTKTSPKAKKEEAQPKECPDCHYVKPPRVATCPQCGFRAEVQSKVVTVDGVLEKVGPREKVSTEQKQIEYEMMRGY